MTANMLSINNEFRRKKKNHVYYKYYITPLKYMKPHYMVSDHKRTNFASNRLKVHNILVSLMLSYLNIASVSFNQ